MDFLYFLLKGIGIVIAAAIVIGIARSIRIVPARTAMIVERLGKYHGTLEAGFHFLIPFFDKVRYTHSLKEQAIDVPSQPCFTRDNVKVDVDGVLYYTVFDPQKASYGITNHRLGTIQLAQTMMRSAIGLLDLDKTFEERQQINAEVVKNLDEATDPWGVKVTRYEIQNIKVPPSILDSMEYQVKAERERRAVIAKSLGEKESKINRSRGLFEEAVNKSEGMKERLINEAEGQAQEILAISKATALSIEKIAEAISESGGEEALELKLAEQYIEQLKNIANKNTQIVLPMDLTDLKSVTNSVSKILQK
ncbi:SPFH domain-containing protein [Spirochaeta cellobiosiphila]|uniref:SPFH domain-containing protein n=1 Tax=Spirochaeta cellobiosiphila TaxID=504483 RepID=UPI0004084700|nr:stomatin-like protein [Spirochaeta cellobiosiphila]